MKATPRSSGRIITSFNLKGGVGKTHLCWLIAGVCQERGKRCLIVDLDKQGNISSTLLPDYDGGEGSDGFFNPAIDVNITTLIKSTAQPQIDLIPGSFRLERFNLTDPAAWDTTDMHRALVDPLRQVAGFYDYILLDCPPDISLITYAALCASNFLLVPLEAAQWGALGTQHVLTAPEYIANGWQIGSGPIEAACKHVIGARFKGSGRRWSHAGANRVSHLRALLLSESDAWENFWHPELN